jgi:hypothetical protein
MQTQTQPQPQPIVLGQEGGDIFVSQDEPKAPMIMVDTSEPAMFAEGLIEKNQPGPGRPRKQKRVLFQGGGEDLPMQQKPPQQQEDEPEERMQYAVPLTITKLE